jgi:hypothetical protein
MLRNIYILAIALLLGLPAYAASPKLEVSVVMDWPTVQHYGSADNARQVIKETFEYTSFIYKRDLDIDLVVTYTEVPATYEEGSKQGLPAHTAATFLVDDFVQWRITHSEHMKADATLLFTVRDIKIGSDTSYIGYARFCVVCGMSAVGVVELEDNGLDSYTVAHELGHILGAPHDGELTEACKEEPTSGYLMEARLVGHDTFSPCSIREIKRWIANIGYECMIDKPAAPPTSSPPSTAASSKGGGSMDWGIVALLFIVLVATKRKRV